MRLSPYPKDSCLFFDWKPTERKSERKNTVNDEKKEETVSKATWPGMQTCWMSWNTNPQSPSQLPCLRQKAEEAQTEVSSFRTLWKYCFKNKLFGCRQTNILKK